NNADSARCAIQKSPGSRVGAFIIASLVYRVVQQVPRTACCFIQSAMTGYIGSVSPFRNRVSLKEAFEGLELGEGKLSRPVLRGPGGRKTAWLLDSEVSSGRLCSHLLERRIWPVTGTLPSTRRLTGEIEKTRSCKEAAPRSKTPMQTSGARKLS